MTATCLPPAHHVRTTPTLHRLEDYLGIVRRNAFRLARQLPRHVEVDDLIGAGHLGLMNAARRFDPTQGARFETFAEHHVRGAMLDAVRGIDPVSRDVRRNARAVARAGHDLRGRLGREPSENELATASGLTVERLRVVRTQVAAATTVSLEAARGGGATERPTAGPPAPSEDNPAHRAELHELGEHLSHALGDLPERLRQVLALYYGEGCSLKQIGERMGFTESRACQLHGEAIHRLRARLDDAS